MHHGLLDAASLHQMLYQALDASDNIVMILGQNPDGSDELRIEAVNGAFCRISDRSSAELIGLPFAALAAREADKVSWEQVLAAARDQKALRSEVLCGRPAGPPFWLGLHLMPATRDARPRGVLLGRDITAVLRDRQQQAAIQGLLAKVFASVQAAVAITDEHAVLMMTNPAFDALLGYPSGGLTGKVANDLAIPTDRAAAHEARLRQLTTGDTYKLAVTLLRADDSRIPVELTSTLVERGDLKRFRIVTATPTIARDVPPVTVHLAGKVKLIGLEDIKTALGERWPAVAARAMAVAEHIVKRRCGPRDAWARTSDSAIVIAFAETTEEEAALRAATIARDIRARLIGEGEQSAAADVSAITSRVELAEQPDRSADMLAEALGQRLAARLAEHENQARATLRVAMESTTCDLEPIRGRRLQDVVGHVATLPDALEDRVRNALAILPGRERDGFDFDRVLLGAAAERAVARIATGQATPILVPFDFEMLMDRRRTERYVATCNALDQRIRRHLVLVLANLPLGVPRSRVQECIMRLRPLCQAVAFQSEELELPAVEASVLNGSIVLLREADLSRWNSDNLEKLGKLIGLAHAARARILVQKVGNAESAGWLVKLGVDMISLANDRGEAGLGAVDQ